MITSLLVAALPGVAAALGMAVYLLVMRPQSPAQNPTEGLIRILARWRAEEPDPRFEGDVRWGRIRLTWRSPPHGQMVDLSVRPRLESDDPTEGTTGLEPEFDQDWFCLGEDRLLLCGRVRTLVATRKLRIDASGIHSGGDVVSVSALHELAADLREVDRLLARSIPEQLVETVLSVDYVEGRRWVLHRLCTDFPTHTLDLDPAALPIPLAIVLLTHRQQWDELAAVFGDPRVEELDLLDIIRVLMRRTEHSATLVPRCLGSERLMAAWLEGAGDTPLRPFVMAMRDRSIPRNPRAVRLLATRALKQRSGWLPGDVGLLMQLMAHGTLEDQVLAMARAGTIGTSADVPLLREGIQTGLLDARFANRAIDEIQARVVGGAGAVSLAEVQGGGLSVPAVDGRLSEPEG